MKWFFCLDDDPKTFNLAKVALYTCRKNTELEPVCLYFGEDEEKMDWLVSKGVRLVCHEAPVLPEINKYWPHMPGWKGMYLRMDLPLLCPDERYLYADVDVEFVGDCKSLGEMNPKYFAAAPQEDPQNWTFFNNGIMFMNGTGMRSTYDRFLAYAKKRLGEKQLFDQDAYNEFYGKVYSRLPLEYNWKAYWSDEAADWSTGYMPRTMPIQIIHWHGPKPWSRKEENRWWTDEYFNETYSVRKSNWSLLFAAANSPSW